MKIYREPSQFPTKEWLIVADRGKSWKGYIEVNGIPDTAWFKGRGMSVKSRFNFLERLGPLTSDWNKKRCEFINANIAKTWVALNNRWRK